MRCVAKEGESEDSCETSSGQHNVSGTADWINGKYGEYIVTPTLMMGLEDQIIDRIAFGNVKELEEVYG